MTNSQFLLTAAACVALTACGGGGGGGGGLNSTPTPSPSPTPTPTPAPLTAQLFSQPVDGNLTVYTIGTQVDGVEWGRPTSAPTTGPETQFAIRYIAAEQRYEVSATNLGPATLVRQDHVNNSEFPYRDLEVQKGPNQRGLYLNLIQGSGRLAGSPEAFVNAYFQLGALAGSGMSGTVGWASIGMATPPGSIPTSGTAGYTGTLFGSYQERVTGNWSYIDGPLALTIDFATRQVSGLASLGDHGEPGWGGPDIGEAGSFAIAPTALGSDGSFATMFQSAGAGVNLFSGRLGGPAAGHAFGVFALPFSKDGASYQAWGSWGSKRQ